MNAPRIVSSQLNSGALTCARTRHLTVQASTTRRSLPRLAGGTRSRPLLGSPLPLKSAQDLRGNVSNHYPSIRTVFTAQNRPSFRVHKGARHAETVHPQILDKSSTGVANE